MEGTVVGGTVFGGRVGGTLAGGTVGLGVAGPTEAVPPEAVPPETVPLPEATPLLAIGVPAGWAQKAPVGQGGVPPPVIGGQDATAAQPPTPAGPVS